MLMTFREAAKIAPYSYESLARGLEGCCVEVLVLWPRLPLPGTGCDD